MFGGRPPNTSHSARARSEAEFKKALANASSGSSTLEDLEALTEYTVFWKGISVAQMTEAASVYCKYLKGAAKIVKFADPMHVLDSSLGAWRETALMALAGLGNAVHIKIALPSQFQAVVEVMKKNWSDVLKWLRYFSFEVADHNASLKRNDLETFRCISILSQALAVISCDQAFFHSAIAKDDELLDVTLKTWWKSDVRSRNVAMNSVITRQSFIFASTGLNYAVFSRNAQHQTSAGTEAASNIRMVVLRAVGGDAVELAKRLLQFVDDPEYRKSDLYQASTRVSR